MTAVTDLGAALGRALASGQPAVLDCRTQLGPHPILPAFGQMGQFGIADMLQDQ